MKLTLIIIVPLLLSQPLLAAKKHESRHHGKHEHGTVEFNIAFQDNSLLEFELQGPAESFVGFEHTPKTEKEKSVAEEILKKLSDPKNILALPGSANCSITDFEIEGKVFEIKEKKDSKKKHKHKDGHSEVEVEYKLQCKEGTDLKDLRLSVFTNFRNIQKVKVQSVVGDKQSSAVLTADNETVPGF